MFEVVLLCCIVVVCLFATFAETSDVSCPILDRTYFAVSVISWVYGVSDE